MHMKALGRGGALDGVSSQQHASAALYTPGRQPSVPIGLESGWAPTAVWTQRLREQLSKILYPCHGSNSSSPVLCYFMQYQIYASNDKKNCQQRTGKDLHVLMVCFLAGN
jgi:hypothetical protein